MLQYLFILCFSVHCFAQLQSLAEYNRTLLKQLTQKRLLTPKELKALRIRLGTEIASADDNSYKQGELLKLLEYASYAALLSKNKDEEKIVTDMWNRYLSLPNATVKEFKPSHIFEVLAENAKNPESVVATLEYYSRFITNESSRKFFLPLINAKCPIYVYLRKKADIERCYKQAEGLYSKSILLVAEYKSSLMSYYFEVFYHKNEGHRIAKEILSDETLFHAHSTARRLSLLSKMNDGDLKNIETDLENIRRDEKEAGVYELLLLKSFLVRNKTDKSLILFKKIIEGNLNPTQLKSYYRLAAELFFRIDEYRKAEFYLNRLVDLESEELKLIDTQLSRAIIALLVKDSSTIEKLKPTFEKFAKTIADFKLDDADYVQSTKLGQLLTARQKVDLNELIKASADFKKYHYPYSLNVVMLEKLVRDLSDKK